MRAEAAESQAPSEDLTVRAALLAVEADLAGRAFIDGQRHLGWCRRRHNAWGGRLTPAPGRLAADVRAVALAADGDKGVSADRAGDRYAIVRQRGNGHYWDSLVAAWLRLAWGEVRLRYDSPSMTSW